MSTGASRKAGPSQASLFRKYFLALFAAVVVPLAISGAVEAWFGYRDQRAYLDTLLATEARGAAQRIQGFVDGIRDQLGWVVQLPWSAGAESRQRLDALRLLRFAPAIVNLTLVDGSGRERVFVSRVGLNRLNSERNLSSEPAVVGARAGPVWFSPVTFRDGSEPFMTIAVAGNRAVVGVAVAEINLKLIADVIGAIRVGRTGSAAVLDKADRLIAHPDLSLVLRGADDVSARSFRELRATVLSQSGGAVTGQVESGAVLAAAAPVQGVDWTVLVTQPLTEAFRPIEAALLRTTALLLLGVGLSAGLAVWLARRMTAPIRLLEDGTRRIGAGEFTHRIPATSRDELGRLAEQFNAMAGELAVAQERSQRIVRLRRFLAPQVADLVDRAGDDGLLSPQRQELVAVFGDLRGFTRFAAGASPEAVMTVLGEYYAAVGAVIERHEGTLTNLAGDGVMVLISAPLSVQEPALVAARMALDLQDAVQALAARWRRDGFEIGFGVGLAFGEATVGPVTMGSRLDYTAIGPVVNLAARLCATAEDGQVLIDEAGARAVERTLVVSELGKRDLKGFVAGSAIFTLGRPQKPPR